jgi:thiamine pyrophosphokinase
MSNCLIVCDGELTKKQLGRFISSNKLRHKVTIIACDGASDFLYKHKVTPHYIIGDLDGINPKTLAYYKNKKVIIKKIADQNSNDLEKALKLAILKKFRNISIIGFSGKRFDHSLNNLSILKRYYKKANIRVYDNMFEMFIMNKSAEFECSKGDIVSLIPLPEAKGVKTSGLKYPLNNETLAFGKREGALNEATSNYVKIKIIKGELLVFRKN